MHPYAQFRISRRAVCLGSVLPSEPVMSEDCTYHATAGNAAYRLLPAEMEQSKDWAAKNRRVQRALFILKPHSSRSLAHDWGMLTIAAEGDFEGVARSIADPPPEWLPIALAHLCPAFGY